MGMLAWTTTLALLLAASEQASETPKIHARAAYKIGQTSKVLRSAEELGTLTNTGADRATAQLARAFKVDSIDWKKQMVIVISGGSRPTGGYSVDAQKLEVKDNKLIVHWKLNSPAPGSFVTQAFTHPMQAILVDRREGAVEFHPPPPKGKNQDR